MLQSNLIAHGQWPYRDFFEFIWPGALLLGALVIKLTGFSVLAIRMTITLLMLSAIWAIDDLAKRFLHLPWRLLLLALLLFGIVSPFPFFSHHVLSAVFSIWALWHIARFIRHQSHRNLCFSGLLSGLAAITTQSLGGLLVVALGITVLASAQTRTWKNGMLFLASALLPLLTMAITLLACGVWPFFWRDTITWLAQGHYADTSVWGYFSTAPIEFVKTGFIPKPHHVLIPIWPQVPQAVQLLLLAWLPVLGTLWGWETVFRHRACRSHPAYAVLLSLTLVSTASLLATCSYSTSYHIATNAWPGDLLCAMALSRCAKRWPQCRLAVLFLPLLLLYNTLYTGWQNYQLFNQKENWLASYGTVEKSFLADMPRNRTLEYSLVTEAIRQYTGQQSPVFIFNVSPEFYFLADRANPTRYVVIYPVYISTDQENEIIRSLETTKTPLLVDDGKAAPMVHYDARFRRYHHNPPHLGPLEDYIHKHYKAQPFSDQFTFYRRIDKTVP